MLGLDLVLTLVSQRLVPELTLGPVLELMLGLVLGFVLELGLLPVF